MFARLRQQHAEAVMQETLDILRDVPAVSETGPLSLPEHESCGFERARGVLAADLQSARVGADARPTRQLEELSADLDAAHAVPVISCGVVGHAPDCECATL